MVSHVLFKIKNDKILRAIQCILNCIYQLIFLLIKNKPMTHKKYYFCVCGIFKDEGKYLKEWVENYRVIGTDHIYLYNNNSIDNYQEILRPYVETGFVTLLEWPKLHSQMEAYADCYTRFKDETNWIAFFDIDEFLCLLKEKNIRDFLIRYEKYPSLMVYWLLFGTNGQLKPKRDKLVIEQYTCSWPHLSDTGKIILSTQERYAPTRIYHHHIVNKCKFLGITFYIPPVNEFSRFLFFPRIENTPQNGSIQINHYFSKSYSEFISKIEKGDVVSKQNEQIRQKKEFFFNHEMGNTVDNKSIYIFLISLKLRLMEASDDI